MGFFGVLFLVAITNAIHWLYNQRRLDEERITGEFLALAIARDDLKVTVADFGVNYRYEKHGVYLPKSYISLIEELASGVDVKVTDERTSPR